MANAVPAPTVVCDGDGTVPVEELLERKLSLFTTVRSAKPERYIALGDFLAAVQKGAFKNEVMEVRFETDDVVAEHRKRSLPAVKLSGTFRGRKAEDLEVHSGLLCLDFDNLGKEGLEKVRSILSLDVHVVAYFRSPGGEGLKVIVGIKARDAQSHRDCFDVAKTHFLKLLGAGATLDTKPSNVASNCFVSYDSALWIASHPRLIFMPDSSLAKEGCGLDTPHVFQSGEKESFSPPSSERDTGEEEENNGIEVDSLNLPANPPDKIIFDRGIDARIWPNWMKCEPHVSSGRNEVIVKKVPLLNNLVGPRLVGLLLLRWFDEAPEGRFKASRQEHWDQTVAMIRACLQSWETNENVGLSKSERTAYRALNGERLRTTFRICRSLSLTPAQIERRTFYMSAKELAMRLECHHESAARQLEYLVKRGITSLVVPGAGRAKGKPPIATTYQWMLTAAPRTVTRTKANQKPD